METKITGEFYLNVIGYSEDSVSVNNIKAVRRVNYAIPINDKADKTNILAKTTHKCKSYDGYGDWILWCGCCSFVRNEEGQITGCKCCQFGICNHEVEEVDDEDGEAPGSGGWRKSAIVGSSDEDSNSIRNLFVEN